MCMPPPLYLVWQELTLVTTSSNVANGEVFTTERELLPDGRMQQTTTHGGVSFIRYFKCVQRAHHRHLHH